MHRHLQARAADFGDARDTTFFPHPIGHRPAFGVDALHFFRIFKEQPKQILGIRSTVCARASTRAALYAQSLISARLIYAPNLRA